MFFNILITTAKLTLKMFNVFNEDEHVNRHIYNSKICEFKTAPKPYLDSTRCIYYLTNATIALAVCSFTPIAILRSSALLVPFFCRGNRGAEKLNDSPKPQFASGLCYFIDQTWFLPASHSLFWKAAQEMTEVTYFR